MNLFIIPSARSSLLVAQTERPKTIENWFWPLSGPDQVGARGGEGVICTVMVRQRLANFQLLVLYLYSHNRHHSNHAPQAGPLLQGTYAVSLWYNCSCLATGALVASGEIPAWVDVHYKLSCLSNEQACPHCKDKMPKI